MGHDDIPRCNLMVEDIALVGRRPCEDSEMDRAWP